MEFYCDKTGPIVATDKGKIRGFKFGDIYSFYGIDYAKAERFRWPEEIEPWDGIKDALNYGSVCPLMFPDRAEGDIMAPHRTWIQDENCQNLNVWTGTLDTKAKKPVMVWLHGGGFFSGSAIEQLAYDGTNMSKYGDVVTVTVNHRLNVLGYLDLRGTVPEFEKAANAGNGDLIYALKWIKKNIEQFGGDPENVTIFGQSGGGGKVITLMQMPEAEGLFHKAIIMSGILGEIMTDPMMDVLPVIHRMLELLDISEKDILRLASVDYHELSEAYLKAHKEIIGGNGIPYFGPHVSPDYVGDPMKVGFTESAKHIPVMIGSVISEFFHSPYRDKDTPDEEIEGILKEKYGEESATRIIHGFKEAYPDRRLYDIFAVDSGAFRYFTKEWIRKRTETEGCAATYNYLMTMDFSINGRTPAWHCADIPFFFHNIDKVPVVNVDGVTDRLQDEMFSSFMNFAHTGNPSNSFLPEWIACEKDKEYTMIFDRRSELKCNFDDELIKECFKLKVNSMPFV